MGGTHRGAGFLRVVLGVVLTVVVLVVLMGMTVAVAHGTSVVYEIKAAQNTQLFASRTDGSSNPVPSFSGTHAEYRSLKRWSMDCYF